MVWRVKVVFQQSKGDRRGKWKAIAKVRARRKGYGRNAGMGKEAAISDQAGGSAGLLQGEGKRDKEMQKDR